MIRTPEPRAVTGRGLHLVAGLRGDDDPDLLDPGLGHRLDPVEQHGLVGHRDQLLGAGVGDRPQPRPSAARQDQALERLHQYTPPSLRWSQVATRRGDELQRHALGGLRAHRVHELGSGGAGAVALHQLGAELDDQLVVAVDLRVGLDHHAAQLLILVAGLDLQRGLARRARGCGPSGTWRRSTPTRPRRAPRTTAASGAASRAGRWSRRSRRAAPRGSLRPPRRSS